MIVERAGVFDLVRSGDRAALAALLSGFPPLASSVDEDGTPLLHVVAEVDDPETVELVLDCGADLDVVAPWGQTALQWAASMGSRRAADALIASGAPLDLWTAAALGKLDEVRAFLNGVPVADLGRSLTPGTDLAGLPEDTAFRRGDHLSDALYIACRNGALDVARFLRALGADVDAKGYFGATALHWAATNGRDEVVAWLVAEGADIGRRDPKFAATPAGWAREGGHQELADRLERLESETTSGG